MHLDTWIFTLQVNYTLVNDEIHRHSLGITQIWKAWKPVHIESNSSNKKNKQTFILNIIYF
jgi:hypothetical protein